MTMEDASDRVAAAERVGRLSDETVGTCYIGFRTADVSATANIDRVLAAHTATLLPDGTVLVAVAAAAAATRLPPPSCTDAGSAT